ncbi:hypothetical protein F4703DRAFT_1791403 [Phycomyces blakesleeanus]
MACRHQVKETKSGWDAAFGFGKQWCSDLDHLPTNRYFVRTVYMLIYTLIYISKCPSVQVSNTRCRSVKCVQCLAFFKEEFRSPGEKDLPKDIMTKFFEISSKCRSFNSVLIKAIVSIFCTGSSRFTILTTLCDLKNTEKLIPLSNMAFIIYTYEEVEEEGEGEGEGEGMYYIRVRTRTSYLTYSIRIHFPIYKTSEDCL